MITLDPNYNDGDWFDQLDEKVFSIKYKIHGWLRDVERESEEIATAPKRRSASRSSRSTSSKGSSGKSTKSSRSRNSSGRCNTSTKDQAIIEEMKVAELLSEQKYIKRRKAAELEAESLRIQQKVEKAKAHAKVLDENIENKNIEKRMSDDRENRITKVYEDIPLDKSRVNRGEKICFICLTKQLQMSSVNYWGSKQPQK